MSRGKQLVFELLGKDPEGVVVSFLSGDPVRAAAMARQMKELVPDRRHFFVRLRGTPCVDLPDGVVVEVAQGLAWLETARAFRGYRIAQAAVLFDETPSELRSAAAAVAPRKILAFNRQLERHHLTLSSGLASTLFVRGVPLDRIFLRPRWLVPWKRDRSSVPQSWRVLHGRPRRPGLPQVAVLSPYLPWPLAHGGAVRIYNLLRRASAHYDISFYGFEDGQTEADLARVLSFCTQVAVAGKPRYREPRWASWAPPEVCEYRSSELRRALKGLPLLQVEYTQMAWYGGDILVEHDVTFDLYRQIHARRQSLSSWWDLWRWQRFEQKALRRARRVVVMSDRDRELAGVGAEVIPNGVDLERFTPQPERPGQRLLFVGSFRHFPNSLAFRWFLTEVLPLLDRGIELTVVAGPDPHLYWPDPIDDPRIQLLGFVADVRPLYAEANVVIIPTLVSAGTNLKAMEAMAMERAMVSTPSGVHGLDLQHLQSVWIAEEPSQFAEGIWRLLDEEPLRLALAKAARAVAIERYGWDPLSQKQVDLWNNLKS